MTAAPATHPHDPAVRARVRWRRVRRRLIGVLVALAGIFVLLAAPAFWLANARPTWWPTAPPDLAAATLRARSLENGLVTLLTEVRPINRATGLSAPWSVAMHADDATAWLVARLPQWAAQQQHLGVWPAQIAETRAWFGPDALWLGARLRTNGTDQFIAARLEPEIRADNALWLPARSISIGRLPLPAAIMFSRAGTGPGFAADMLGTDRQVPPALWQRPEALHATRAIASLEPLLADPSIDLHDGRRVRLLSVRVEQGRLLLVCRTEWAGPR